MVPESLAALVNEYLGSRKNGFLFETTSGLPVSPRIIQNCKGMLGSHGYLEALPKTTGTVLQRLAGVMKAASILGYKVITT
jgi:hypothetical protein